MGRRGNEQLPQLIGSLPRWIHEGALCPDYCRAEEVGGGPQALMLEIPGGYFISEQGVIFQISFNFYMMSYGYN